jgi:hypothetical protein
MTSAFRSSFVVHVMRAAAAIAISIVALLGVMAVLRFAPVTTQFSWYGVPIAIAAGYVPLWRWYRRDAYPIGLVFCPLMFFILRGISEWASPWFWPTP